MDSRRRGRNYRAGLSVCRQLLSDYEEPKLDVAVDEALQDYIALREREIPEADELNQDF